MVAADLPGDVALLKQVILDLDAENARLRHQLAVHQRARFGPRRERLPLDQAVLFPDDALEPLPVPPPPPGPATPAAPAGPRRPQGRRPLPPALPRERVVHAVPPADQVCTGCERPLVHLGDDETEELEYTPAALTVTVHVYPKYACRHCQDHVVQQPVAPRVLAGGRPGPGLLAHVVVSKYADHLPLHRQSEMLARHGCAIARSTLADWVAAVAEACRPLVGLMASAVRASAIIHTDDIPVPVLDRTRDRTKTGRLWPYLGDTEHRDVVFDYTPTRSRDGPQAFLRDWRGYLQADAYAGYDRIYAGGQVIEVACWAHVRRKFFEARVSDRLRAHQAIAFIRRLYDVERDAQDLAPAERLVLRQARAVPVLSEIEAWLRTEGARVLPRSPMGEACTYARNQWAALTRYCEDGRLAIDNNAAERLLRGIAVGRKNWTFAGSDAGAAHAAILYSLLVTCRLHGIEPFAYLRDVLTRLPTHPTTRLTELTPRGWQAARIRVSAASPTSP